LFQEVRRGLRTAKRSFIARALVIIAIVIIMMTTNLVKSPGYCSVAFIEIPLWCPLGIIQRLMVMSSPINAILLMILPTLALLLIGPFFCAWICPVGLLVQRLGKKCERPSFAATATALGLLILASYVLGYNAICIICPLGFITILMTTIKGGFLSMELTLLVLSYILFLVVVSRYILSWCSICPLGLFFRILGEARRVVVTVDQDKCVKCGLCSKVCTFGLDPSAEVSGSCSLCLSCIEVCPRGALKISIKRRGHTKTTCRWAKKMHRKT